MRLAAIAVLLGSAWARADDLSVGASVGAGAQGAATYGAVEVRLDASWPGVQLGLGARGVWDDGVFRRADWGRPADAVTIVRDFEAARDLGGATLALAAGQLAPARIGHLADACRAALDDRWRTGARTALTTRDVELGAEIDDVLDPALIGGALRWQMAPPVALRLAIAGDPHGATAFEAGADHRYAQGRDRLDVGGALIAEIGLGVSAVAFADGAIERGGVRWTARGDVRAGSGTVGALFGPLYRVERLEGLLDRARRGELSGVGAGASVGAAARIGSVELGVRERPGLGPLVVASGVAPMARWLQAGLWAAGSRSDAAGAAELRVAWAHRLFSALQVARFYRLDLMEPAAVWSVTAWFGATSE